MRKQQPARSSRTGVNAADARVEQEEDEVLLVEDGHAVVDPRAVVVHPDDAAPARAAVVRLGRLHRFALLAHARHCMHNSTHP